MGRMPGLFVRVTLACVRGAALIAAVAVGLVDLCCLGFLFLCFFCRLLKNFGLFL